MSAKIRSTSTGSRPEAEFFEAHQWFVAGKTAKQLTPVRPATGTGEPPYASASFERVGDRWAFIGWGQCRIEVSAPGRGNARFVLDPDTEPDPDSTTVSVLGYETTCPSGAGSRGPRRQVSGHRRR